MTFTKSTLLALVAAVTIGCGGEAADFIAVDGLVYTSNPERPVVEAFAVRDGRFWAIGSSSEIRKLVGAETAVLELEGVTVLPGLIDGHVHLGSGQSLMRGVNLYGIADRNEWLDLIAARAAELPPGSWIVGGRWDHTLTPGSPLPTKEELDTVAPENPVALGDVDGHSTWASSLALELAEVDASTPDPQGGEILHDPDTGEPTGILLETAGDLVRSKIPPLSDEERLETIQQTLDFAHSLGLTGAHDMSGHLEDYADLAEKGDLNFRVWFGQFVSSTDEIAELDKTRDSIAARMKTLPSAGPMLQVGFAKLLIDGVLSTRTALMLEPYADAPDEAGLPIYSREELNHLVAAANSHGFSVAIHAIGDRGVRMSLDAFEDSPAKPAHPNRIEHIEVIDPQDIGRFADLGVLAVMNPHHCITGIDKYNTARLGEPRVEWAFAWGKIQRAGANLVFGSDWATAPLNPMEQFYAAVVREKPSGGPPGGWFPENKVSFQDALFAYTQAPADAVGWGDQIGSITPGKWADFVVLDRSLPDPVDGSILERRVQSTYVGGKRVYSRP